MSVKIVYFRKKYELLLLYYKICLFSVNRRRTTFFRFRRFSRRVFCKIYLLDWKLMYGVLVMSLYVFGLICLFGKICVLFLVMLFGSFVCTVIIGRGS